MGVVYSIVNKINDATYIGSAIGNGNSRWIRHKKDLKANNHHNIHLQRAYNKHGINNFEFIVLENVDNKFILTKEQKYLDDRKKNYPANLNYNICWTAGNCSGRQFSVASIKQMSNSHLGKTIPATVREQMSKTWGEKANKTYTLISPENKTVDFRNIRKFCRDNGLENGAIGLLLKGEIYYYKGWVKDYSHTYSFISPEGIVHENITNLTNFCVEHDLRMKGMSKLHRNGVKSYYGWTKFIKK
jgi:group I intron endonuclease